MADMKVYVLENGMNIDSIKNDLISCDDPNERFNFPSWTVLIRHAEGNILFDAACHRDPARQLPFIMENLHMTEEDDPVYRIRQLGLAPEDIGTILLSHMHPDHFGYIDKFPNAEIIVSDDEFTYMMRDYALNRFPFTKDFAYFIEKKLKWRLFPSDEKSQKLMEGVTIMNFGRGHSYGMLGLLLELPKSGNKLLISDTIYSSENVGPPLRKPGICRDMENWLRSMAYVLALAKERDAEIWYGHDLAQFETLIKSTEGYYE
ncbi:MAG: N-acyl homoserine lactonase family protein [Clostridiales Family XIII bacterium]|jgi:glyoxylase-like metal-dependent hydrolase (beta-lactamase superfamily II)|nr:N-acyl homoserine lactonase family protein [Clostridiales Family XIII bacterium]